MRISIPGIVLALSAVASASFYLEGDAQVEVDQPKNIQWNVTDFDASLDIFIGDEDANEDTDGKLIGADIPNVGTFTWTPDQSDIATNKKKKKIWGKDKKGKKNKGKQLIIIIIGNPGKVKKPIETPLVPSAPQQTLPPGTTRTTIATLTSLVSTQITATQTIVTTKPGEGKDKPKNPPPITTVVPVPVPPVPVPTEIGTAPTTALITNTVPGGNVTRINPTPTTGLGNSPPIFTGAADTNVVKPAFVGGLAGLLILGML